LIIDKGTTRYGIMIYPLKKRKLVHRFTKNRNKIVSAAFIDDEKTGRKLSPEVLTDKK
jgi:hypothetical protein